MTADAATPTEPECANPVHAHPLPKNYIGASEEAGERLESGWDNVACTECGRYGWLPPKETRRDR